MVEVGSKKEGYGHLLKWVVKIGDLCVINFFFIILYLYFKDTIFGTQSLNKNEIGEALLLINIVYFITASIIKTNISFNIIFFDKVTQNTFSFITVYTIILIVGVSLFSIVALSLQSWVIIYISLSIIYILWHIFFRIILKLYRRKGYNYKKVIIIGGGQNGMNVYKELSSSVYGYKVLGYFDDNPYSDTIIPNYLGATSRIEQFCIDNKVDEMYCTLPGSQEAKILNLMNLSEKKLIRFYLVPEFYKYIKRRMVMSFLQSTPVIALRKEPLQSLHNRIIKRAFDIVFSSIVLLTIFPVILLIFGSLIKLTSPGPIFFKQKRTGLEGKVFNCWKFRSMRVNKDADSKATVKSDPRVTRIGAFMRKTSIDEMPQFINVLIGDMSVVGPRPHMIQQTELYLGLIDKFLIRHLAKPGITGWAQVSGYRGETRTVDQMEGRFKRDIWYIENWSFMLDIKIIFVTILNLFRGEENAY